MSVEDVLRTLVGDVPWRYLEDNRATSIGRLLGKSSGLPPRDVILPSGRDLFPGSWVSGSHVPGSQFQGPGCQGPVPQGHRVPGLGSQVSEVLGLRVSDPGFRLCLCIVIVKTKVITYY